LGGCRTFWKPPPPWKPLVWVAVCWVMYIIHLYGSSHGIGMSVLKILFFPPPKQIVPGNVNLRMMVRNNSMMVRNNSTVEPPAINPIQMIPEPSGQRITHEDRRNACK
jgi:hypothetical protein